MALTVLHSCVVVWNSGAVLTRAPLDIDGGGAILAIGYTLFWDLEKFTKLPIFLS